MTALGQPERPLASVLLFLAALDEAPPDESVDQARGRRRGSPEGVGQIRDGRRPGIGEDIQRRQLGEAEAKLPELPGEPDHELAPERASHRDPLGDLARILDRRTRGLDRSAEGRLERARDRPLGRRATDEPRPWSGGGTGRSGLDAHPVSLRLRS